MAISVIPGGTKGPLILITATATTTGVPATTTTPVPAGFSKFALQVVQTGVVTSWDVRIESSLDGTNYDGTGTGMLQQTNAAGSTAVVYAVDKPTRYIRINVAGIVLGVGTNIVITAIALPS